MSVLVGVAACEIFGGGFFTFALVGFLFLLFLSIYVWEPHVRQAVERAADVLTGGV